MMYSLGFLGGLMFFLGGTASVLFGIQMTQGFWLAARVCFALAIVGAILMCVTLLCGTAVIIFGL